MIHDIPHLMCSNVFYFKRISNSTALLCLYAKVSAQVLFQTHIKLHPPVLRSSGRVYVVGHRFCFAEAFVRHA